MVIGEFVDGLKDNTWRYLTGGALTQELTFEKGELELKKEFDKGKIGLEESYNKGELVKRINYESNVVIHVEEYQSNEPHGTWENHLGDSVQYITFRRGIAIDTLYKSK
ncbi:hypothetical protein [Marinoscillum sp.]|uniref:hypothetical protein n=1 Tax=Marinoscillum sp. TaxID=2024838 RepID=UPI003BA8A09C